MKNQFSWGLEISAGGSFPDFPDASSEWKAGLNAAGMVALFGLKRLSPHWAVELSAGFTQYALVYRAEGESYLLDFGSPHGSAGIEYHRLIARKRESFIRLSPGILLGYKGTYTSQESTYTVEAESDRGFHSFARMDIGIRKEISPSRSGLSLKGRKAPVAHEVSAFYRHNFSKLGTARFISDNYDFTVSPRGSIMGVSIRVLFPYGKTQLKEKETEPEFQKHHSPRWL